MNLKIENWKLLILSIFYMIILFWLRASYIRKMKS